MKLMKQRQVNLLLQERVQQILFVDSQVFNHLKVQDVRHEDDATREACNAIAHDATAKLFTLLDTMDLTRRNHRMWMITIYLFLMAAFLYLKPSVAFGREGRIRPFGATDREATVFPVWWWVFIISVVAYCMTVYLAGFRFTS
jgi:hypothetical protein